LTFVFGFALGSDLSFDSVVTFEWAAACTF
jgi:hypothetical protein